MTDDDRDPDDRTAGEYQSPLPFGGVAALGAEDLTPEELEGIRASQDDPETSDADDPEVG